MSDKFHAGSDFVKKAAKEAAELAYQSWVSTQGNNNTNPNWFIGQVNSTKDKITHPNGTQYNLVFTGQVTDYCLAYIVDSNTAYGLGQEKIKVLNTDSNNGIPYVIYWDSSNNLYMSKGTDSPHPLDPTLIPSGIAGNPLPVFCNESPALLVYGFSYASTFVLTLKWGILTNFKLSGGVWTGTITTGNINVDFSSIPQPSHPSLIPQDPLGKYGQAVEVRSSLSIAFESLGLHDILPQVLFWKDASGDFHFGICGAYTIDYESVQNAQNDGTHTQFFLNNLLSGRFLVDINQRTGASSLSYVQDLSSIAFCTWTVIGTNVVILNDPNYTVSGYLSGVMSSTPPEPSSMFFRSKAGVFASALGTFNTFFDPNNHWCSPWNVSLPASIEPNIDWVVFTDSEYITSNLVFGGLGAKATDSEQFIAINPNTFLKKYSNSGNGITAGQQYNIGNVGSGYNIADWMVY